MISKIFPKAYKRYISLPLFGSIIPEITEWFNNRGYASSSIRGKLKELSLIDKYIRRNDDHCLQDLTHVSFQKAWAYYHKRRLVIASTVRQIEQFLSETQRIAPLAPLSLTPTETEINLYIVHLKSVRGFSNSTIHFHTIYLREFIEYIGYESNNKALRTITIKQIEDFLCICAKRLNRYVMQHVVAVLRSFLRFQYEQNILQKPLHTQIDTPRVYRLEKLPRSLPWETVKNLINSVDRTTPQGIRDYTILFLIATYGLRASEIVKLTLEDIDWRHSTLRIPQSKTRNSLFLPLTNSTGNVLIKYLKKSRPELPYRELFLRVRAPSGPLKPTAVSEIFQLWTRRSGLDISYQGSHCLRHSYAVHLLRQGTTLKAIGDILGHRTAESTCVYLRLSVDDLRTVALPIPSKIYIAHSLNIMSQRKLNSKPSPKKPFIKLTTPLKSFLAENIKNYLKLMRALGRNYGTEERTLLSLDVFLVKNYSGIKELTVEIFNQWCLTFSLLKPTVRRIRMLNIRKFCLYRCRSYPKAFIPDILTFPTNHQPITPYIFAESDIARLLSATKYLRPSQTCPVRKETVCIAILLLYTTGLRLGELLRLRLCDYNSSEKSLFIKDTKFHKSRLIPLSTSVSAELDTFIELRLKKHLPMDNNSPLIWNGSGGTEGKAYTGTGFKSSFRALCFALKILTKLGKPPRIHDLRHSFAVTVLQRWYKSKDAQVKLPLLSTYLGHVSVNSTCYYLTFVEGIQKEASTLFKQAYGSAVITKDGIVDDKKN